MSRETILAALGDSSELAVKLINRGFDIWGENLDFDIAPEKIAEGVKQFVDEFLSNTSPNHRSLIFFNTESGSLGVERVGTQLYIIMDEANLEAAYMTDNMDDCIEDLKGACDELIAWEVITYFYPILRETLPKIIHPTSDDETITRANECFGDDYPIHHVPVTIEL